MFKLKSVINIERVNIGSFDDSLTSQEELPGTKISEIFRRFQQTGVLPCVGRIAIPVDLVAGGYDFSTLRALIDEAKANGVSDEQLSALFSNNNNGGSENGDVNHNGDSSGDQPGSENSGEVSAGNDGQNAG